MRGRPAVVIPVVVALCVASFLLGGEVATASREKGIQWQFTEAARWGDVRSLERLHDKGAEIDKQPSDANEFVWGSSALIAAARAGNAEAVQWLLEKGSDPNRIESETTPLDCAEGRLRSAQRTIEILQKHGAKHHDELTRHGIPAR